MPQLTEKQVAQAVLDCCACRGTDDQQDMVNVIPAFYKAVILEAHAIGCEEAMDKAAEAITA